MFKLNKTKTHKGLRDIPLTMKAVSALRQQQFLKYTIINKGKEPMEGFEDMVFVTNNNKPTTQFLVSECIDGIVKFEGMAQFERAAIG